MAVFQGVGGVGFRAVFRPFLGAFFLTDPRGGLGARAPTYQGVSPPNLLLARGSGPAPGPSRSETPCSVTGGPPGPLGVEKGGSGPLRRPFSAPRPVPDPPGLQGGLWTPSILGFFFRF